MIEFRLLGTVSLRGHDGVELREVLTQPKRLALLAYLAVTGDYLRRDALLGLFWQEQDATQGRNALRQALHHLRQALGDDAIVSRGANEIAVDRDVLRCDAALFQQAVDAGHYAEAVELYRGELMPAFFFNGAPVEWEEWLASTRQALRRKAALSAWRLAADFESRGDAAESARHARLAAGLTPDDEPALRSLLTQLVRLGDHAGARHAYESFRHKLARDLAIEPSAETKALVKDIPASRAVPPAPASEPLVPPRTVPRADSAGAALPDPAGRPAPAPLRRGRLPLVAAISAGVLLLAFLVLPRASGRASDAATPALRSVAVLPFADERGDTAAALGVVIADELIASLSRVHGLRVSARAGPSVDAVLRGSVRRSDSSTVALVQLRSRAGDVLWSRSFTGRRSLTLALQDSVVSSVVATLAPWLGDSAAARVPPTTNVNAWDFYLRGRALTVNGPGTIPTESGIRAAVRELRQAIALDSSFARAHAALTQGYIRLAEWVRPREILPLARASALRALELDSADVDTRVALGDVRMIWDRDWRAAEVEYRRALAGDSANVRAREAYARFLRASRRFDEAAVQERAALTLQMAELPDSEVADRERLLDLVDAYERGNLGRADSLARAATAAHPDDVRFRWLRGMVLVMMNRGADAVRELELVRRRTGDRLPYLTHLGVAYARAGREREARAILADLRSRSAHSYVPRDQIAAISLALGDTSVAIAELRRAVDDHHWWMYQIVQAPLWAPLHRNPAFLELVDRVGAPRPTM